MNCLSLHLTLTLEQWQSDASRWNCRSLRHKHIKPRVSLNMYRLCTQQAGNLDMKLNASTTSHLPCPRRSWVSKRRYVIATHPVIARIYLSQLLVNTAIGRAGSLDAIFCLWCSRNSNFMDHRYLFLPLRPTGLDPHFNVAGAGCCRGSGTKSVPGAIYLCVMFMHHILEVRLPIHLCYLHSLTQAYSSTHSGII